MRISSCSSVASFFNKLRAVPALVSIAVVCGAGVAHALPAYYPTFPAWATATFQGGRVAGSIFTATTAQTFNSLGFIDLNASSPLTGAPDGLLGSYQVGIWLVSTQTLLASAIVTPASPLGVGEFFRYAPIPTTTIPAGQQFIIGALLPATPLDAWLNDDAHVDSVGISGAGTGRFEIGGTLTYPTQIPAPLPDSHIPIYSVANASSTIVPEPSTGLLMIAGLFGLAHWRRRQH
jgi:PEP-CTERM motif